MANLASISVSFESAEAAGQAFPVVEDMIKLYYAPKDLPWMAEAVHVPSLSMRWALFGEKVSSLDPLAEHPSCALKWLSRSQNHIVIERCADIQHPVDIYWAEDFFTQLCLCLSKCIPDPCFSAICRHEETVSNTIQLNRILCEHGRMTYEERWLLDEESDEDPDENDWSRAGTLPLQDSGGVILRPSAGGGL